MVALSVLSRAATARDAGLPGPTLLRIRAAYQAAARNSSIRQIPEYGPPLTMAWGTGELDEFQRQSREFADAWEAAGHTVERFILDGQNHFEVAREMFNPDQPVFKNILKNIGV